MELCYCRMGVLVNMKDDKGKIGHVVGLDVVKNDNGKETVPCVRFADEMHTRIIHHGNLEVFKG